MKEGGIPIEELERSFDHMLRRFGRLSGSAEVKSETNQFCGPFARGIPVIGPAYRQALNG